jgi:hypothetical protein
MKIWIAAVAVATALPLVLVGAGRATPPSAPPPTKQPSKPTPPPAAECTSDADCTTTTTDASCCGTCGEHAISRKAAAKQGAYCAAHRPKMCPALGCAFKPAVAACDHGRCITIETGPGALRPVHP